jgi:hypothetical protein
MLRSSLFSFSPRFAGTDKRTCIQHVMTIHLRRKEKEKERKKANKIE